MAQIGVFEDNLVIRHAISDIFEKSSHIIAFGTPTLEGAHKKLTELALGHICIDYALIDGTLQAPPVAPTFRFTPPGTNPQPQPRRFMGLLPPRPSVNPHEIIVEADNDFSPGSHGRQIGKIIKRLGLPIVTIGISSDNAASWDYPGGEGVIEQRGITKSNLPALLPLIEQLEAERARNTRG